MRIGKLQIGWGSEARVIEPPTPVVTKAALGDLQGSRGLELVDMGWAPTPYGNYYAQSVPAYRAIKVRSDAVAEAPLIIYRREGLTKKAVPSNHPMQKLFDRVNNWWTAADLWKATEIQLCLWGSAFWLIDRDGPDINLWLLRTDRMQIVPDRSRVNNKYILGFNYTGPTGEKVAFLPEEIMWARYINPMDEYSGLSPIAAARMSLNMGMDALKWNATWFKNGARPDVVYPVSGPITDEQAEDFYARLDRRYKGTANAHRPMLWDMAGAEGAKPERLGATQADMEFLATLNWTVEDAARVWGVPPPKMYSQAQSIYNNVKQADVEFYTGTISSEWVFLATEINEMMLPKLSPGEDLFAEFDTSKILPLQEALAEQRERERLDVEKGIVTINEARAARNMEPVPWGHVWWISMDIQPAGTLPPTKDAPPLKGKGFALNGHIPAPDLTDEVLDRASELAGQNMDDMTERFFKMQADLFDIQSKSVVSKLGRQKSAASALIKKDLAGNIFDPADWAARWEAKGEPLVSATVELAANSQAAQFNLGAFDAEVEGVRQWERERVKFWVQSVNAETASLLLEEITAGQKAGESIVQIQERVLRVFRFSTVARAQMIARTEVLAASNFGHISLYKQSGVVDEKMWLAALDERTRPDHVTAHKQRVALNAKFQVGGEQMDAPGVGGSAKQVVNCRCTTAPVVRKKSALESLVPPGGKTFV
jgi:HK97 family phage portal protein